MFNWFKSENKYEKAKEALDNFKPECVPQEEPETPYYTIGPTNKNRVMLKVYYGNITMDEVGIDDMITTLQASKVWCKDESGKQPESACQSE